MFAFPFLPAAVRTPATAALTLLLALAAGCSTPAHRDASSGSPARIVVNRLDELPRHTYPLPAAPSAILGDDAAIAALRDAVKADLLADLAAHDIRDRTTIQRYTGALLTVALLEGDDAAALRLVGELRELEEKDASRLTTGLITEALVQARADLDDPSALPQAFQRAFAAAIARLPWETVATELKDLKAAYEVRSEALLRGVAREQLDPAARATGAVSSDVAWTILNLHHQITRVLPLKDRIVAVLTEAADSHQTVMVDNWTPRLVALDPSERATPVRIAVWDSGVDVSLFGERVHRDADGRAGIAFDRNSVQSDALVLPLGEAAARIDGIADHLKGFSDLQANIDSPEASAIKRRMATLGENDVRPFLEDLGLGGNWSHGTHVAGIALEGNPFARLVTARITFDHRMIPERPTVEQARRDAAAAQATVDYLRSQGVRVVNMSWGGSLRGIEEALEMNGVGADGEERAKLAREIFDIGRDGLLAALRSAPEILWVAAAGNADNNVAFDEFIPSSFQLANMITVGAVDKAGAETSFSSFGPMVNVHANGFEVESFIPGGRRLAFSGTSMAAPQVTNLAGKLLALDPTLTPEQLKELILAGCDREGRVNLVNPARSVALLRARLAGS